MAKFSVLTLTAALAVALSACGGGGGGSTSGGGSGGGGTTATVTVSTLAGSGAQGNADGTGAAATFDAPYQLTVDANNTVYVSTTGNNDAFKFIRKITSAGVVTTVFPQVTVPASNSAVCPTSSTAVSLASATFGAGNPIGVTVDANGNLIYLDVLCTGINTVNFTANTIASRSFNTLGVYQSPQGGGLPHLSTLIMDKSSGSLYVPIAYDGNPPTGGGYSILKIAQDGTQTIMAGAVGQVGSADGQGAAASFNRPFGLAVDASGNLYIADAGNNKIRKMTPAGVVSTVAGGSTSGHADGTGTAATFNQPIGVGVDSSGNLYVADTGNFSIRKITPAGVVTTIAGSVNRYGSTDGDGATVASFSGPQGVAVDASGKIYVADTGNKIRVITISQ